MKIKLHFIALLFSAFTLQAQIERQPYLQLGTSTSVIIRWRTTDNTESVVNFGTALGALNSTVSDNTAKTDHELTITGLTPNTKYFYEIADADDVLVAEDAEMYYMSAPAIGTKQFFRAWILGDAGKAGQHQRDARDSYYDYFDAAGTAPGQTDLVLLLGDNAYNDGMRSVNTKNRSTHAFSVVPVHTHTHTHTHTRTLILT